MRSFVKESQKTLNVGNLRNYDEEWVFFEKNVFISLKAFFTKMEVVNNADDSQPFF